MFHVLCILRSPCYQSCLTHQNFADHNFYDFVRICASNLVKTMLKKYTALILRSSHIFEKVRPLSNGGGSAGPSVTVQHTKAQISKSAKQPTKGATEKCGPLPDDEEDDLVELEEMFVPGPAGMEWNGPTRGGRRPEPTRFGDWERKGRISDF